MAILSASLMDSLQRFSAELMSQDEGAGCKSRIG